jgi:hypothetical protein
MTEIAKCWFCEEGECRCYSFQHGEHTLFQVKCMLCWYIHPGVFATGEDAIQAHNNPPFVKNGEKR